MDILFATQVYGDVRAWAHVKGHVSNYSPEAAMGVCVDICVVSHVTSEGPMDAQSLGSRL